MVALHKIRASAHLAFIAAAYCVHLPASFSFEYSASTLCVYAVSVTPFDLKIAAPPGPQLYRMSVSDKSSAQHCAKMYTPAVIF
jgi:hypothetical protein